MRAIKAKELRKRVLQYMKDRKIDMKLFNLTIAGLRRRI